MYAVVKTGGKQYRVEPGIELLVEKLEDPSEAEQPAEVEGKGVESVAPVQAKPKSKPVPRNVELSEVLLFSDGSSLSIGRPLLPVSVHCLHLGDERGPKLRTVKYRRRKNSRRSHGHRQWYSRLRVERIETRAV